MRKRDREKIAQSLYDIIADLDYFVLQQLNGGAWYFERNSEYKGFDFSYAGQRNLASIARKLKKFLDASTKEANKKIKRR